MLKTFMIRSNLVALVCCVSFTAHAMADAPKRIDVPAGELVAALETLSRQAAVDLVFQPDQLRPFRTDGVSGTYSPQDAIRLLLKGTPLQLRTDASSGAMVIAPPPAAPKSTAMSSPRTAAPGASSKSFWSRLRLAQSDSPSTAEADAPNLSPSKESQSRKIVELEEIVVTGTHIRGTENPTAPLVVMDRALIDATGLATAVQLIESLPQNFALANQSTTGGLLSGVSLAASQGSSINLRGMGEGTTLVLVNGRRMALGYDSAAVDISALPLSAVERVEILTDGASAIYGSDAVGGVVNFILRRDYEGADTRVRAGFADGTDEYRFSQTLGADWDTGNVVLAGEHYRRDLLLSSERDFGTATPTSTVGSLLPEENNYSAVLAGRQSLTPAIELFADGLYARRNSFNRGSRITASSDRSNDVDNEQISAALGLGWDLGHRWRIEAVGSYGRDELEFSFFDPSASVVGSGDGRITFEINAVDVKADGPLFDLPGGAVLGAIGGHWRAEKSHSDSRNLTPSGTIRSSFAYGQERRVNSIFGEVLLPLIGENNARRFLRRVNLSAAARYDDYSDFGSSLDPRVGIALEPVRGLTLRGSWGTSYLAPKLSAFNVAFNGATAGYLFDPALGRPAHILAVRGNAVETLMAQEARHYTFGLEWQPSFLPRGKFAVGYYDIDYSDRIALPPAAPVILGNPTAYTDLFIRNPTVAQVNEYIALGTVGLGFNALGPNSLPAATFDPSTVEVIIDGRRRNMSVVKTNGLDLSMQYDFDALGGALHLKADGTYILELVHQVTQASAPFDQVSTFSNPPHLRLRGQVGYRRGGWSVNGFLNHTDSYTDNRFAPFVKVASWTTVDANIGYRFGANAGVFSGAALSVGAINLLDRDPPPTRVRPNNFDLGFDAANASPLGRKFTVDLSKQW